MTQKEKMDLIHQEACDILPQEAEQAMRVQAD